MSSGCGGKDSLPGDIGGEIESSGDLINSGDIRDCSVEKNGGSDTDRFANRE